MSTSTSLQQSDHSLLRTSAASYGMEPAAFAKTVLATVFPDGKGTNEQLAAFLAVATQYKLNPFTRQIYAFPAKGGGIIPIVSIDGWAYVVNQQAAMDGMVFEDHLDEHHKLTAVTCKIYRKDRQHPTEATEYMIECVRDTEPWRKWPRRMLRHKAMIQCARYAFALGGIYDPDEGERIIEAEVVSAPATVNAAKTDNLADKYEKQSYAREEAAPEPTKQAAPSPVPGQPRERKFTIAKVSERKSKKGTKYMILSLPDDMGSIYVWSASLAEHLREAAGKNVVLKTTDDGKYEVCVGIVKIGAQEFHDNLPVIQVGSTAEAEPMPEPPPDFSDGAEWAEGRE